MKNECYRVHGHDSDWCVLTFPKQNKAIVYNANTKRYDFYNTDSSQPHKSAKLKAIDMKATADRLDRFYIVTAVLAGALGVSLALNIMGIIF